MEKILNPRTLSETIKYLSYKKGVSVRHVCNDLNINYNSFTSNIKKNKPKADTLIKFANYFNVDFFELNDKPIK